MTDYASRKVILVADDQPFIRSLLNSMLRELGYRTLDASDGNQAVEHLARRLYGAILDQRMEGPTGLDILRAIRSGQTRCPRDLPVLLLTGHADERIVQVASQLDVSALLSKPVSKAQLKERLDAVDKANLTLKSAGSYAAVEVNPAETAPDNQQPRNAWVLRNAAIPREAPLASAARPQRRLYAKNGRLLGIDIHYSRLEPGMVVARDLYSSNGTLLLAAGSEVSKSMARRLLKICESNPDLTYLRVAPQVTPDCVQ